jgi:hypothetical protein
MFEYAAIHPRRAAEVDPKCRERRPGCSRPSSSEDQFFFFGLPSTSLARNTWNSRTIDPLARLIVEGITMRYQPRRPTQISAPAPMHKSNPELPTSGYALVVDGQVKAEFKTEEGARRGAEDLKQRFPMLQIRVYDAKSKRIDDIVLSSA